MDKISAQNLIKDTFNYPFNEEKFSKFSINLLEEIKKDSATSWRDSSLLPNTIKGLIAKYKYFGSVENTNGEKIVVAMVKLQSAHIVEKSRNIQREFATWLINTKEADACLISFFADNYDDWRFSLVQIEYKRQETESGRINVKKEITPIKRFSYLVGKNEPNYTAQSQLSPLLEKNKIQIDDLSKAFSVEKVTEEFFDDYKNMCFQIRDEITDLLKKDPKLKKEFGLKKIDSFEYSKKFMGQLIFLYFLQKKGWLGIKNKNTKFDTNSGPRNFFTKLFNKEYTDYKNFYNDILEPLFYEGLSRKHENNYFEFLKCKLPFFNISLFEPIQDYDWENTQITIKNSTIEKLINKFKRFNFTISEDQDLDQEIAVDPEMLGKVLENLMQDDERKLLGVFYTPRNIVFDMCKSSLLMYLKNNIEELEENNFLNTLINVTKNETFFEEINLNKKFSNFISKNKNKIDTLLQEVKILDPAVGSGAFLVEILSLIVNLRYNFYKLNKEKLISKYNLKKFTIKNSIYGVDINDTSIEIAKLRLWLAMIVDEEKYSIYKSLPNLEFNLCSGNSLSDSHNLFVNIDINLIQDLKNQYYDETDNQKKRKIEKQRSKLLQKYQNENIFNFEVNFYEVFSNGGFDLIIGNPPYEILKSKQKNEKERLSKIQLMNAAFEGELNYFKLFISKSINLLKQNGLLNFIFQYSFLGDKTCSKIRQKCLIDNKVLEIQAFPERDDTNKRVFESAKMSVCTLLMQNKKEENYSFNLSIWKDKFKKEGYKSVLSLLDIKNYSYFKIPTGTNSEIKLVNKILNIKNCSKLKNFSTNHDGEIHRSQHKNYYNNIKKKKFVKMYNGASIQKWYITENISQGEIKYANLTKIQKDFPNNKKFRAFNHRRIAFQGITGINEKIRIKATILNKGFFLEGSGRYLITLIDKIDYESLIIIFNSSLINWFFKKFNTNSGVKTNEVDEFPIRINFTDSEKKKLQDRYKELIKLKVGSNSNINIINKFEKENDDLIFDLYGLTETEKTIVYNTKNDRY